MASAATIVESEEDGTTVLRAEGEWLVVTAADLDRRLHRLEMPKGRQVTVDLSGVDRLDSTGAWLLLRTEHELAERGNRVELSNLQPRFEPLLAQVRARGITEPLPHPVPPHYTFVGFLERIGRVTVILASRLYDILGFTGLVTITLLRLMRQPSRLRLTATLVQMEQVGLDAMPIVGLLSFLIGIVMAYQGADQLRRFGAEIYTVNLLGISILRELGVLLSAIIIAGRSGSAFTAQIGTMQVNEEIDAMRTLGLDPIEVLVLPRLLGLALTLPLLVFFADFMGILGGGIIGVGTLGISPAEYYHETVAALNLTQFIAGLIKAGVFGVLVALSGCLRGMQCGRSASAVGEAATSAVVTAIVSIIVSDAILTVIYNTIGV